MNDKIFVIFDFEKDLKLYNEMETWKNSEGESFNLVNSYETYKLLDKEQDEKIKELINLKIEGSSLATIILGQGIKSMRKLVKWQIEAAITLNIPLVVMNLNRIQSVDYDRVPSALKNVLALHTIFDPTMLEVSLHDWVIKFRDFKNNDKKGPYKYSLKTYELLKKDDDNE